MLRGSGILDDPPRQPFTEMNSASFLSGAVLHRGFRVCCFLGYAITGTQLAEVNPQNLLSSKIFANLFSPEI